MTTSSPVFLPLTEDRPGPGLRPALGASCQSLRLEQAGIVTHRVSSEDPESLPAVTGWASQVPARKAAGGRCGRRVGQALGHQSLLLRAEAGDLAVASDGQSSALFTRGGNRKSASPSPQSSVGRESARVSPNLGSVSHKTWVSSRRTSLTTRSMLIIGLKYRAQ